MAIENGGIIEKEVVKRGHNLVEIDLEIIGKKKPKFRSWTGGWGFLKFFGKNTRLIGQKQIMSFVTISLEGKKGQEFEKRDEWQSGRRIYIIGKLQSWSTGQDESKKYGINISVERYYFFEPKKVEAQKAEVDEELAY